MGSERSRPRLKCKNKIMVRNYKTLKTFSVLSNELHALNKASNWSILSLNLLLTNQILEHTF